MEGARHVFEEHVGEVQMRIEAPTLAELFAQAGRALAELVAGAPESDAPRESENVSVEATDREALLAEWLNELIFRSEVRHCAFTDLLVTDISDRELQAQIAGVSIENPRVAVKAATLHGLHIQEHPGGYTATVVLDV
ncbi:MAG: archease [Myxococcales bacterium]